jgi:hypothetical protein
MGVFYAKHRLLNLEYAFLIMDYFRFYTNSYSLNQGQGNEKIFWDRKIFLLKMIQRGGNFMQESIARIPLP